MAALSDYQKLHQFGAGKSEIETLQYCGAIFMAFQFKKAVIR